jgi:hypothetical protein
MIVGCAVGVQVIYARRCAFLSALVQAKMADLFLFCAIVKHAALCGVSIDLLIARD